MSERDVAGRWRRLVVALRRHEFSILFALALFTLLLGYVGLVRYYRATGEPQSLFEFLYQTIQIFSLGLGVGGEIPWELDLARFLGPMVLAVAGVKALLAIFEEQLEWHRARRLTDHVIVCGLSEKGRNLTADFLHRGSSVVVVEIDASNESIRSLRDLGAVVLVADAKDPSVLRRAGSTRARYMIAACGNDGTNVEIAVAANKLLLDSSAERPMQCFIHIADLFLLSEFKRQNIFMHTAAGFQVRFFNLHLLAARALFDPRITRRIAEAGRDEQIGFLVIGFGGLGQSVALQIAHFAHFGAGRRPRLIVVDREMETIEPVFGRQFAAVDTICKASYHGMDMRGPELAHAAPEWIAEGLHLAVICLASDSEALSCALSLRPLIGERDTCVFLDENAGLAAFISDEDFVEMAHIDAFGARDETCTPEVVVDEVQDVLARAIHDYYRELYGGDHWDQLADYQRDSNRLAADHLAVKLYTVGCEMGPRADGFLFADGEIELMARMEHERWRAEKFLDGWQPGETRDNKAKRHPDLLAYGELPESSREKNREAVRAIPEILARIDRGVRRQ